MSLQSHKGTFGTHRNSRFGRCRGRFNPTRVRLEHLSESLRQRSELRFNPTRVRLERRRCRNRGGRCSNFNPTRVRLERDVHLPGLTGIDTSTPQGFVWNDDAAHPAVLAVPHFNPTRVRLERFESAEIEEWLDETSTPQGFVWNPMMLRCSPSTTSLQPHKGSSGTDSTYLAYRPSKRLQPHKGSSGTHRRPDDDDHAVGTSTPQGFVWNERGGPRCR